MLARFILRYFHGLDTQMLARLFESQNRKAADQAELDRLQGKYGDTLVDELRTRAERAKPDARSYKHWQRLLRKLS